MAQPGIDWAQVYSALNKINLIEAVELAKALSTRLHTEWHTVLAALIEVAHQAAEEAKGVVEETLTEKTVVEEQVTER